MDKGFLNQIPYTIFAYSFSTWGDSKKLLKRKEKIDLERGECEREERLI